MLYTRKLVGEGGISIVGRDIELSIFRVVHSNFVR